MRLSWGQQNSRAVSPGLTAASVTCRLLGLQTLGVLPPETDWDVPENIRERASTLPGLLCGDRSLSGLTAADRG